MRQCVCLIHGVLRVHKGVRLGDAARAGETVEWKELAVVEQQKAVGDVAHARELMRRDE